MALSRKLLPVAAGLMLSIAVAAPARAQSQNMDTVLRILVDVLAASVEDAGREEAAQRELDAELATIDDERQRVAAHFDRRRAEVERRAERQRDQVARSHLRKRERRHRIREIEQWRYEELSRLDAAEADRMAELDRRQYEVERRYSYGLEGEDYPDYGGYPPDWRQVSAYPGRDSYPQGR